MKTSVAVLALLLLSVAGCKSDDPDRDGAPPDRGPVADSALDLPAGTSVTQLGVAGGRAISADGKLEFSVPAGALSSEVAITISVAQDVPTGNIPVGYDIGPTGMAFNKPASLLIGYDTTKLQGISESRLRLGTVVDGAWQIVDGSTVDVVKHQVSGQTMHLSAWGTVPISSNDASVDAALDHPVTADQKVTPDLAVPDHKVTPDQSVLPDQKMTLDQSVLPDQKVTPDQSMLPDQKVTPDLAVPDQNVQPDHGVPPDLTPPPDLFFPDLPHPWTTPVTEVWHSGNTTCNPAKMVLAAQPGAIDVQLNAIPVGQVEGTCGGHSASVTMSRPTNLQVTMHGSTGSACWTACWDFTFTIKGLPAGGYIVNYLGFSAAVDVPAGR